MKNPHSHIKSQLLLFVVCFLLLAALFALLILRGYWIARCARDRFSMMLAAGLTTLLAVQTILNLCVQFTCAM